MGGGRMLDKVVCVTIGRTQEGGRRLEAATSTHRQRWHGELEA
jgi:hypothetical protein